MAYTQAQLDAATSALYTAIHGIHTNVAREWARAEQGDNYNILGVTHIVDGVQELYGYSSWAEGAQAAARLIMASPYYAGIRATLHGSLPSTQAAAIIASPWNHPYYSSGVGAEGLRHLAAMADVQIEYHVHILGRIALYHADGRPYGHTGRASYGLGQRHMVAGHWQYPILSLPGHELRPTRLTRFY